MNVVCRAVPAHFLSINEWEVKKTHILKARSWSCEWHAYTVLFIFSFCGFHFIQKDSTSKRRVRLQVSINACHWEQKICTTTAPLRSVHHMMNILNWYKFKRFMILIKMSSIPSKFYIFLYFGDGHCYFIDRSIKVIKIRKKVWNWIETKKFETSLNLLDISIHQIGCSLCRRTLKAVCIHIICDEYQSSWCWRRCWYRYVVLCVAYFDEINRQKYDGDIKRALILFISPFDRLYQCSPYARGALFCCLLLSECVSSSLSLKCDVMEC